MPSGMTTEEEEEECIEDMAVWWELFENSSEARCVSSDLLTTIQGPCSCPQQENDCSDYANWQEDRELAWFSGSDGLEDYLE